MDDSMVRSTGRSRRSLVLLGWLGVVAWSPSLRAQETQTRDGEQVAVRGAADVRRVTIDADNLPLQTVLNAIAAKAGLNPAYVGVVIAPEQRVTLHVHDVAVIDAFRQALQGTGLRADVRASGDVFVRRDGAAATAGGVIVGVVTEEGTKKPLHGAKVTLDGLAKGVETDDKGMFRIAAVAAGEHRVSVKMIGHGRLTRVVTVQDDGEVHADFVLGTTATALDQVVVTGTVVPTELKAVPNAITVITAKELEQRGITHIDQLFRGDVPGLWAQNQGSNGFHPGQIVMQSRGSTTVDPDAVRNTFDNHPIKTYVDGIELADPSYLGLIDPRSIERIEIIPGPQASTIYGANAVNGVMQVFTKRGSPRPQITLTLQSGVIQNNYRSALTPQHDYSAQISGTQGPVSYNAGGTWNYVGPWTPAVHQATTSGFSGIRIEQGKLVVDGSFRRTLGTNWANGIPGQSAMALWEQGQLGFFPATRYNIADVYTSNGQTLGLSLTLTPVSWWTQTLRVGSDAVEARYVASKGYSFGGDDTLNQYTQTVANKSDVTYTTTVQGALTSVLRAVVTGGADGWHNVTTDLQIAGTKFSGSDLSGVVARQPSHDRGAFVQAQLSVFDQVFLTYGLRAEWNPNYGKDVNPKLTPRYGIAATRDIGSVTAKVRASYGTATQVPSPGETDGLTQCQNDPSSCAKFVRGYGHDVLIHLPNAGLLPSFQRGGEGGIDLYLGSRGSVSVTYFNQTVNNLILFGIVDSVESIIPALDYLGEDPYNCYPCGWWQWQVQYVNAADIRNAGLSLQGTWNIGPLTTTGTYSWNRSRVIGVTPRYRQVFPTIVAGAAFLQAPEHTFAGSLQYARAGTTITLNLQGQGIINANGDPKGVTGCRAGFRLKLPCGTFTANGGKVRMANPGYARTDLNVTHRLLAQVDGLLQIQNLSDSYQFDGGGQSTVIGRQSKAGLRIRW